MHESVRKAYVSEFVRCVFDGDEGANKFDSDVERELRNATVAVRTRDFAALSNC